jgi:hypothetical protein
MPGSSLPLFRYGTLLLARNMVQIIQEGLLQRDPSILISPFLQQRQRQAQVRGDTIPLIRNLVDELVLGEQLAQQSKRLVPSAVPTPCLDALAVDIWVQGCGKMEKGNVLDVDGEHW